jgi:hypothetical protein
MSIFEDYLKILSKCYSLEIELKSFLPFIQKYPQFKRYYKESSGEFDNQNFLYEILNNGTTILTDPCYVDKKERKNIFAYIWTLIEMESSYIHIAYCLPIVLQRIRKDKLFTSELSSVLSEPHDIKNIIHEYYVNIQGNIIDFLAFTYPDEIKVLLKKYKFDMITDSSIGYGSNEPDYSYDRQYLQIKNYLQFLKSKSEFLIENFPCNINYSD